MITSTINVLGYHVFADNLNKINTHERLVINTLNGHSYSVAKKDYLFHEALNSSDILLPDGVSVTIGARFGKGVKISKIAGFDIFEYLLRKLNKEHGSCFFLGSMPHTLNLITDKLKREYSNIKVATHSPPYVSEFSEAQSDVMCQIVNEFKPDVLFVGMTAPKQEKWVYKNKESLSVNVICSIGAVFDFYAGTKKRPANWMIKCNLEWLGRFISEPKRLFYRYFISTPAIFFDVLLVKFQSKEVPNKKVIAEVQQEADEVGSASDLDIHYHYKILEEECYKNPLGKMVKRPHKEV